MDGYLETRVPLTLYFCLKCSCAVGNKRMHDEWHNQKDAT